MDLENEATYETFECLYNLNIKHEKP